jgi:hypothetical protein
MEYEEPYPEGIDVRIDAPIAVRAIMREKAEK